MALHLVSHQDRYSIYIHGIVMCYFSYRETEKSASGISARSSVVLTQWRPEKPFFRSSAPCASSRDFLHWWIVLYAVRTSCRRRSIYVHRPLAPIYVNRIGRNSRRARIFKDKNCLNGNNDVTMLRPLKCISIAKRSWNMHKICNCGVPVSSLVMVFECMAWQTQIACQSGTTGD